VPIQITRKWYFTSLAWVIDLDLWLVQSTWTELTCNKSSQLHDAFIGHARQRVNGPVWTHASRTFQWRRSRLSRSRLGLGLGWPGDTGGLEDSSQHITDISLPSHAQLRVFSQNAWAAGKQDDPVPPDTETDLDCRPSSEFRHSTLYLAKMIRYPAPPPIFSPRISAISMTRSDLGWREGWKNLF